MPRGRHEELTRRHCFLPRRDLHLPGNAVSPWWGRDEGGGRVLGTPSRIIPDRTPSTPAPRRAATPPDAFAYFMRGWHFDEGGGRLRATPPPPTNPPRRDKDPKNVSQEAKTNGEDGRDGEGAALSLEGGSGAVVALVKSEKHASVKAPETPVKGLRDEVTGQQGEDGGMDLEGGGASSFPPASGVGTSADGMPKSFPEGPKEPQDGDGTPDEALERVADRGELEVRSLFAIGSPIFSNDLNMSEEEEEMVTPPIAEGTDSAVDLEEKVREQAEDGGCLDLEGEGASTTPRASGVDTSAGGALMSVREGPEDSEAGDETPDQAPECAQSDWDLAVQETFATASAVFCDGPNTSDEEEMPPSVEGPESAIKVKEAMRQQAGGCGEGPKEPQPMGEVSDEASERAPDRWDLEVRQLWAVDSATFRDESTPSEPEDTPPSDEGPESATELEEEAVGEEDEEQEVMLPRRSVPLSSTPGASGFDTSSAETPRDDEDPQTRLVELADAVRQELELMLQQRGASASASSRALGVDVSADKVPPCCPEEQVCKPEPATELLEEVVGQEVLVQRHSVTASVNFRASRPATSAEREPACSPEEPETRQVVVAEAVGQIVKLTVQRRRAPVSTLSRTSRVDRSGDEVPERCPDEPKKPKARRERPKEERERALAAYQLRVQRMLASVSRSDPALSDQEMRPSAGDSKEEVTGGRADLSVAVEGGAPAKFTTLTQEEMPASAANTEMPHTPPTKITLGETGRTSGGWELSVEVQQGGASAIARTLERDVSAEKVSKIGREPSLSALGIYGEETGHVGGGAEVLVEVQRGSATATESPRTTAEQSPGVKVASSVSGAGTALRGSAAVTVADGGAVSVKGVEACEEIGQPGGGQAVPSSVSVGGVESATSLDDPTSPVAASPVASVSPKPLVTEERRTRGAVTTTPAISSREAAAQEAAVTKSPGRVTSPHTSHPAPEPTASTSVVRGDQARPKAKVSCLGSVCKWARARLQLTRYECTLKWTQGTSAQLPN
jgi:hypothetical protein